MDKPLISLRGAIGDLVILLPITKAWLENKYNTNECNVVVVGPLNKETVKSLLAMVNSDTLFIAKCCPIQCKSSATEKSYQTAHNALAKVSKKVDLYLNHVKYEDKKQIIMAADQIVPDLNVDFTSVTYDTIYRGLPFAPNEYVTIAMTGNSNRRWHEPSNLMIFADIMKHIMENSNLKILLMGKHNFDGMYAKIYPDHLYKIMDMENNGRLIPYYNCTDLNDAIELMKHAKFNVTFDNGLKNFAFLNRKPCLYIHDPKWHAANPIEAWFPKQLQEILAIDGLPLNVAFDASSYHTCESICMAIVERFIDL